MSGYRKVNYYELCRLCTSSDGDKTNIFRDEGRRRQLQTKIQTYLPVQVLEEDSLPNIVCHECVKKLEDFIEFRENVITAEGMLESYFTSLRFSEDFLREGKVYVKYTEKERPSTPEDEVSKKSVEKVPTPTGNQVIHNEQHIQHQHGVVIGSVNASNIQIVSGTPTRIQQYKYAMPMQSSTMVTVVESTTGTHYNYQQQTSQVSPQQSNEAQNQVSDQQNSSPAIQQQTQNQIQNQINQQVQSQRTISQQLNQPAQLPQQQNQSQVSQQQSQLQISQQFQQLQRQQHEFEKQHRQLQQLDKQQVQIGTQQEFQIKQETCVVHQNNNVVLKTEIDMEPTQQIIQKIQSDAQKDESPNQNVQTYTTIQTTPEVFLNLGFKESSMTPTVRVEEKNFSKTSPEDGMSRNSIEQIKEFLRLRSAPTPDTTPIITVSTQAIAQSASNVCLDCGKSFASLNQMNQHNCNGDTFSIAASDIGSKEESARTDFFNCDTCGKSFKQKEMLVKHQKLHTNEPSDTENKEETVRNLYTISCNICGKLFKRKEHLYQHRKLHSGERPYVCPTCAKAFSRKEHLIRHSILHTGQKTHECEACGKSFSRKDNLYKHQKTHGPSGPYICETCGKSFVVKHYYVMHITTHAGEVVSDDSNSPDPLPYKCDICHKAFSVKQYLNSHKTRHRSKNNNSSVQNSLNEQQQSQTNAANNVNVVTNNVANAGNLNNNNGQSNNESTVEMQSVIERNEQADSLTITNSQYHTVTDIQDYQ